MTAAIAGTRDLFWPTLTAYYGVIILIGHAGRSPRIQVLLRLCNSNLMTCGKIPTPVVIGNAFIYRYLTSCYMALHNSCLNSGIHKETACSFK